MPVKRLTAAIVCLAFAATPALAAPGDADDDGVPDERDLCPYVADVAQRDTDVDLIGDRCDRDDDNDGLSDDAEAFLRTAPRDVDTDDDGLEDGEEDRLGTEPRLQDTDRDGLHDGQERGVGRVPPDPRGPVRGTDRARFRPDLHRSSRTDPRRRDSDRDRLADGREDRNRNGRRDRGETDPGRRDTDGDGVPDGAERFPLDARR